MSGNKIFHYLKHILIFVGCCLHISPVFALPFNMFDARTMAMGGVGIASGTHNAVFNNPALLTTADEIHEWFLLLPAVTQEQFDPDDLEDNLEIFQDAANVLDMVNNPGNQNAVQSSLNELDGIEYHISKDVSVMLAIPSRILSGAVFLNAYESYSANPVIGGDNLTIPTYASTLTHRGIRVIENGVSAARVLDPNNGWADNMAVGFSAKFMLLETYNYETGLRSADVKVDGSQGNNGSQFGLDIGMIKEFGVWKVALVGKNIIPGEYDLTGSDEKLKIDPQLRAGFAYESRLSVVELNIDLLKNDPVGFESEIQSAAIGWEYRPRSFYALRAGANKNLVGTKSGYLSAGFGLYFGGVHFDIAGYRGTDSLGMSGQLGFQF